MCLSLKTHPFLRVKCLILGCLVRFDSNLILSLISMVLPDSRPSTDGEAHLRLPSTSASGQVGGAVGGAARFAETVGRDDQLLGSVDQSRFSGLRRLR